MTFARLKRCLPAGRAAAWTPASSVQMTTAAPPESNATSALGSASSLSVSVCARPIPGGAARSGGCSGGEGERGRAGCQGGDAGRCPDATGCSKSDQRRRLRYPQPSAFAARSAQAAPLAQPSAKRRSLTRHPPVLLRTAGFPSRLHGRSRGLHETPPAEQVKARQALERRIRSEELMDLLDRRSAAQAQHPADQLDVGQIACRQLVVAALPVKGE